MALVLKIRLTEIDDDQTYIQYEDENDTLDTDEQYGQNGNSARADIGLFLYVTKKEVGDDEDSIIYGGLQNGAPETAVSWQADYEEDNWYEAVAIASDDYVGGTTYALNDVTFYSNRLWISLQAANTGKQPDTNSDWWLDVTDDKDNILDNGLTNYYYTVEINDAVFAKASTYYAQQVAENTKNGICKACDHEDDEALKRIELHLQAAGVADYQQLMTQAQWNIESLKTLTT